MVHLIVLQHGLWGETSNTEYLSALLQQRFPTARVLNSGVNAKLNTYDGIDVCGERLVTLILDTQACMATQEAMQQQQANAASAAVLDASHGTGVKDTGSVSGSAGVTHLSLVGYSMGGLIVRYAAGRLLALGFFKRVQPVALVTIATPHLGSWRMPISMLDRTFNALVPVMTSRSGTQLMLKDVHAWGQPLLVLLCHPRLPFMEALTCFSQRMMLANIMHDRPVPFCTGMALMHNPYDEFAPHAPDPKYPSIVVPGMRLAHLARREAACTTCAGPAVGSTAQDHPQALAPAGRLLSAEAKGTGQHVASGSGSSGCGPSGAASAGIAIFMHADVAAESNALAAAGSSSCAPQLCHQGALPGMPASRDPHTMQAGASQALTAAAVAAAPIARGPVKGSWMRVVMVALLPLFVPVMLALLVGGLRHRRALQRCATRRVLLDAGWLQEHYASTQQGSKRRKLQLQGEEPAAAAMAGADDQLQQDCDTDPASGICMGPDSSGGAGAGQAVRQGSALVSSDDASLFLSPASGPGGVPAGMPPAPHAHAARLPCSSSDDALGSLASSMQHGAAASSTHTHGMQDGSQPCMHACRAGDVHMAMDAGSHAAVHAHAYVHDASHRDMNSPEDCVAGAGHAERESLLRRAQSASLCVSVRDTDGGGAGMGNERSGEQQGANAGVGMHGGLHVRLHGDVVLDADGLAPAKHALHLTQEWMSQQLHAHAWKRVDVDTRHFHAHAAIIMRNPSRFMDNADVLHYVVDHMAEWMA